MPAEGNGDWLPKPLRLFLWISTSVVVLYCQAWYCLIRAMRWGVTGSLLIWSLGGTLRLPPSWATRATALDSGTGSRRRGKQLQQPPPQDFQRLLFGYVGVNVLAVQVAPVIALIPVQSRPQYLDQQGFH